MTTFVDEMAIIVEDITVEYIINFVFMYSFIIKYLVVTSR